MSRRSITVLADDNMPGVEACCAQITGVDFTVLRRPGRELVAADVAEADWLFVRSITSVNAALLAGSRVRFVGTATIGTDHLDLAWLNQQGIAWASAPGCNARAVGEWVLAMLVRLAVEQGERLAGKTLGIVGLGHVGRWVATLLAPLGLTLLACDPLLTTDDWPADAGVRRTDWPTLLAASDIVTIHTPLTRQGRCPTFHLVNADALAQLKPSAWLLNAARGAVIDHAALSQDLQRQGRVVALDVWEGEPLLRADVLSRVRYGSPHIAGHSLEGKWRGTWQIAEAAARAEGLALTGGFADILPANELPLLDLPATGEPLARLHAVLQQVLDQAGDDARLRAAQHAAAPGSAFDALRKHYPVRREFPAQHLRMTADDPLRQLFIALGFSC